MHFRISLSKGGKPACRICVSGYAGCFFMSKVLISCEQADMKNLMITPNNIKGIFNDLNNNFQIDYKINRIEILRPIQFYKNYLINAKWRIDYEVVPNGKRVSYEQFKKYQSEMDKKIQNSINSKVYMSTELAKVPIQIEPDDGKEKPIKMDRDMGEMLYGTEVKNGKLLKKVFQAKVVGGVLDLTKIKEKDLKIIRERGIHPRRSGRGRER